MKPKNTKSHQNNFQLFFKVGYFLSVFAIIPFWPILPKSKTIPKKSSQAPITKVSSLSYVSHGNRNIKKIALTFDADMTPYMLTELDSGKIKSFYNKEIVDILRREHVPATIFVAGMWAQRYPQITKELFDDPLFEIANHSYSHPRFTLACFALPPIPAWGKDQEFVKSQEAIKKITGVYPKYFRFPGGCQSKSDIEMANKHGLTVVGWDAASTDSFNNNLPAIINSVKTKTQNGSIILFHFHGNKNAPRTAQALPESIRYLKEKGFQFIKLSELLSDVTPDSSK